MFKYLRLRPEQEPQPIPTWAETAVQMILEDPHLPISLLTLNQQPEAIKQRAYRNLLPIGLLHQFEIDPITWKGPDKFEHVQLIAPADKGVVRLEARHRAGFRDPFAMVELEDNRYNGVDLNFLIVTDPFAPRFEVDVDPDGRDTLYGTVHRHRAYYLEPLTYASA